MEVAPGGSGDASERPMVGAGCTSGCTSWRCCSAAPSSSAACWSSRSTRTGSAPPPSRSGTATCSPPRARRSRRSSTSTTPNAQESIDAVAAGATGDFAKQYDTSTKDVVKILTQAKSVMEGKVLWAGVVDADSDSASVIVATSGTVAEHLDRQQAGRPPVPDQGRPGPRGRRLEDQQRGVRRMSTPRKGQSRPATGRPRKIAGRGSSRPPPSRREARWSRSERAGAGGSRPPPTHDAGGSRRAADAETRRASTTHRATEDADGGLEARSARTSTTGGRRTTLRPGRGASRSSRWSASARSSTSTATRPRRCRRRARW